MITFLPLHVSLLLTKVRLTAEAGLVVHLLLLQLLAELLRSIACHFLKLLLVLV